MVENERRRTANRECSRQYGVAYKVQARFDFGGQFIAKVKKPTAEKWQLGIAAGLAFSEPPAIQRAEKSIGAVRRRAQQLPIGRKLQCIPREREKYVEPAEFAVARSALQEERVAFWPLTMEPP